MWNGPSAVCTMQMCIRDSCKREEILPLLRRELDGTGGHSGTNERKEGES